MSIVTTIFLRITEHMIENQCKFMNEINEIFENDSDNEFSTLTDTKVQKTYKVVLYDDETHTYDYVVEMLTKVCQLSKDAAFRCAVEVDMTGRTIVYTGSHNQCLLVMNKIIEYGPDHRMPNSFGSMEAEIQE